MRKQWKVNKKAPRAFLNKFPEYSKLTLQLLWARGLKTQKTIDEFFNPDYDQDLHDPFLLKDIKKAIKRIEKAAKSKEKVAIFADYDADGVCGATILFEILKVYKIKPKTYIPDRNIEGYGLNLNALKEIAKKRVKLILTIDCGVTDFEEVKLANKLGMEVIIIDHHEIPEKLPPAFAIVNPKQRDCKYPFKYLSATGLAFKLAQAIAKTKKISIAWGKWLLDLVAIATATDSMILLGENRTLMKYGLIVLSQTKRPGLQALMEVARVRPVYNSQTLETNLTTYTLGFVLGPRINAASRIDHGGVAYKLLITRNDKSALEIARRLETKNRERQQLTDKIFKQAKDRVSENLKNKKLIIEGSKDWPAGIAGLIAQKLLEEFWRPVFIYQILENFITGSARGIPGFNTVRAMANCKKLLKEYGGHPMAGGFKLKEDNLDQFKELLEKETIKQLKGKKLVPILNIDSEISIKDLNWQNFEEIEKFAPFGECNRAPLFWMKKLDVLNIRKVGSNGGHLKMVLEKDEKKFNAIGFGLSDFCAKIKQGDKIDVVFELIANEWNGTKSLELKIVDLRHTN